MIYGNAIGIDVEGGSATISSNHIYVNTTGIKFGTAPPLPSRATISRG